MGSCWPKPVQSLPSVPKLTTPPSSDNKGSFKSPKNRSKQNVNVAAVDINSSNSPVDKQSMVESAAPALPCRLPAPINTVGANGDNTNTITTSTSRNLKMFTYSELRSATKNFRPDTVLGEGGFGRVFKGWIDEKTYAPSRVGVGIPVAVKKSNPDSEQGLNEWQAEVKFLGKFCHPNLVKLLGYCWEDDQFLLVYEYMQRGSLEGHLFRRGAETLAWETRLKIAVEAARGLEFLHSTEKQVIYRDFKSSNILLDMDFNAKLSDFGLAKLGPMNGDSHVTTQVVGTYGYAAPEYMATGHLYVKSDVYGFGVVLLEILSGRAVLDVNRPTGEHNLVEWAKPLLPEKRKLRQLMDPRLEGQYPLRAATQIAELILKCLDHDPKKRPSMEQVLDALKEISTIKVKPKPKDNNQQLQKNRTHPQHQHQHKPTHHRSHNHNSNNYRSPPLRSPAPPSVYPKNASAGTLEAPPQQKLPATRSY